jgi:Predicted glycosyl hydrolase
MISKTLQKAKLISILTLPPMRSNEITSQEFLQLIHYFDRINLMTYDFSPMKSGPNNPLPWISDTIDNLIQENEIDFKKILLGLPFYGYDYKDGRGNPVTGRDFIEILQGTVKDV